MSAIEGDADAARASLMPVPGPGERWPAAYYCHAEGVTCSRFWGFHEAGRCIGHTKTGKVCEGNVVRGSYPPSCLAHRAGAARVTGIEPFDIEGSIAVMTSPRVALMTAVADLVQQRARSFFDVDADRCPHHPSERLMRRSRRCVECEVATVRERLVRERAAEEGPAVGWFRERSADAW